jgi:hypothetical protein
MKDKSALARAVGRALRQAQPAAAPSADEPYVFESEPRGLRPIVRQDLHLPGPDPDLKAALAAAGKGDWRPAAALLAATPGERRWWRVRPLARLAAVADGWLQSWLSREPGSPDAALVHAVALVELAWALRGQRSGHQTTEEQYAAFHRVLAQAEAPLREVARMTPTDPCPWIGLLALARGLMWPHERMRGLWSEVVARAPYHYAAHASALQYWCAKWCGSDELMHQFAESAAASAPPGTLLSALRLQTVLEKGMLKKNPVYGEARTTSAIEALAEDIAAAPADHPALPEARHLLAWTLRQQRRFGEAAEQLCKVDGYLGALPWMYAAVDGRLEFYDSVRTHVFLAAEREARDLGAG